MTDPTEKLLRLAQERNIITDAQANLLQEEVSMFPGSKISAIIIRRGMASPDQVRELEAASLEPDPEPPPVTPSSYADFADQDFVVPPSRPVASPLFPSEPERAQIIEPTAEKKPVKPLYSGLSSAISAASEAIGNIPTGAQRPVEQKLRPLNVPSQRPLNVPTQRPINQPRVASTPANISSGDISPDQLLLKFFRVGRERGCSDLHLTVGQAPYCRLNGKIVFLDEQPLTAEATERLILSVLTSDQRATLKSERQLDLSFGWDGVGRFRSNVYLQRLGHEGSFRFIPEEIPTMNSLGLSKTLEKLTTYTQGLNLVTGPGGSGKTSTVAAMLELINNHRPEHIITVEDPVEYVFVPQQCQITQREVGTHTESFATALRTALRQDPDVIMIGELRDLDTTSIAITAAETGHLVFSTMHTPGTIRTVARILDVFPPAQRAQICVMVAESLRGITSQQLIDRKDGRGRACAMEILLVTTGISQVIKEGKTQQLVSHMQSGRKLGMISMDDAIMELVQSGVISGQTAYATSENKAMFENVRNQA